MLPLKNLDGADPAAFATLVSVASQTVAWVCFAIFN